MHSMESGTSPERRPLGVVAVILLETDEYLAALHADARNSLLSGDMTAYTARIYDQTKTISELSGRIEDCRAAGAKVGEDVASFALLHSGLAGQALEDGDEYTRIAFLPMGRDKDGPTSLRLLANSIPI